MCCSSRTRSKKHSAKEARRIVPNMGDIKRISSDYFFDYARATFGQFLMDRIDHVNALDLPQNA